MRWLQRFLLAWVCAVALALAVFSLAGLAFGGGQQHVPMGSGGALAAIALSWMIWRRLSGAQSDPERETST